MRPKPGCADQPNIQEDLSPQVPDVDEMEEVGMEDVRVENNGHNDGGLKLDVDLDLEEELIDGLLKIYMNSVLLLFLFLIWHWGMYIFSISAN